MARVLFTADLEEGNIFASFGLAKQLRNHGNEVLYVGVSDAEAIVRSENFDFYPILQSSYPNGSKYPAGISDATPRDRGPLCKMLTEQNAELDSLMFAFAPNVIIVPPYMALESLVLHLRYRSQIVHLRSAHIVEAREKAISRFCDEILDGCSHADGIVAFLEDKGVVTGARKNIVERIAQFPEFVTLPSGYEPADSSTRPNTFFIGASLDIARNETPFDWTVVDPECSLIFCTLGSQAHRDVTKSERFFRVVLDAVAERRDWFLVMAVGNGTSRRFPAPSNAFVTGWAPQLEILSSSRMMIMHGGMGTTRECIWKQVPMLVHPLMRDQYASAEAIRRHGLGLVNDDDASADNLRTKIDLVLNNSEILSNLASMKERFAAGDRRELGVRAIEEIVGHAQ